MTIDTHSIQCLLVGTKHKNNKYIALRDKVVIKAEKHCRFIYTKDILAGQKRLY